MQLIPLVLQILQGIQLASTSAPQVVRIWDNAKLTFSMLFAGGLITAEQQAALMQWADTHQAETLAGFVPPEFLVEPDPV